MTLAPSAPETAAPNTPAEQENARRYNRIRRRLSLIETAIGLGVLVVLIATGWSATLRDVAYRGAGERYSLALFFYIALLTVITKALGFGLDFYGFRLEHKFDLSNQSAGAWARDQIKAWLLELALGTLLAEFVYWTILASTDFWWLIAWGGFIAITIVFAQLAPVVLLPIFYKFKPLEDEHLKQRLTALGERAGTRVRGVYEWKLSE